MELTGQSQPTGKALFYKNNTVRRICVEAPKCYTCDKSVYPAEEIQAAGKRFHKLCCKCRNCGTLLNSHNLTEHDEQIYCKACYARSFGPRGVGHGIGAGILSMDSLREALPITPPGTPKGRSGSATFNGFHERKNSLGSSPSLDTSSPANSDDEAGATASLPPAIPTAPLKAPRSAGLVDNAIHWPVSTSSTNGSSQRSDNILSMPVVAPKFVPGTSNSNLCQRCNKIVYIAEEIKATGRSFHKRCFTCVSCKKNINGARYCEHSCELYCPNCYQKQFGPKGTFMK